MKLIVHLPASPEQEPFKQTADVSCVPNVGETLGVQPTDEDSFAQGYNYRLGWIESRRFFLSADGEISAEIWLTENPKPVVETTTVNSCRRAIQMEGERPVGVDRDPDGRRETRGGRPLPVGVDHYLRWRTGDVVRPEDVNIDQARSRTLDHLREGYAIIQRQHELAVRMDPEDPRVADLAKVMDEFQEATDKLRAELKDEMVERLARHLSGYGELWDTVGESPPKDPYREKARYYLSVAMGEEP